MYGYNNPYMMNAPQNMYPTRINAMQGDYIPRQEIVRVNGENGARAFNLPPNSSVLLLDETAPIVWVAQTDGAGYKTVTPYTIALYQSAPSPDYNSLEQIIKKLEDFINESNNADVKSKRTSQNANAE